VAQLHVMKKLANLFLLLLITLQVSFAQNQAKRKIDVAIDSILNQKYTLNDPGIAILVAEKGEIIYRKAFGSANLELQVPMKADMLFNLGSITKQFTAVAILQLMENNKLSLQDSIQQYIPSFPSKGYTITIEQLLTHTSGLKDYLQIDYQVHYIERRDFEPKELIELFKKEPLAFEPGTKHQYSNTGYFLLGYIIEVVSEKSYEKYLKDHIFDVLGLTNTYYDSANKVFPNRTYGYKKNGNYEKADYWGASIPYAAGGIISNIDDLFKWHMGLKSYKVLKKQTIEKAFTPFKLKDGSTIAYGYGWIVHHTNNLLTIEHGGAITGYRTNEIYYPSKDVFIAILTNCDCSPINELSVSIPGIALGKQLQESIKIDDSTLRKYIGVYKLTTDAKRSIKIVKENGILIAHVSGQEKYPLLFQSDRKFEFKNIQGAKGEFILANEKVLKFIISQNGIYEWKKIE
jgi:CubicO group peptidase (beta-lactamase class C family)